VPKPMAGMTALPSWTFCTRFSRYSRHHDKTTAT
jgi:hypothetical protein